MIPEYFGVYNEKTGRHFLIDSECGTIWGYLTNAGNENTTSSETKVDCHLWIGEIYDNQNGWGRGDVPKIPNEYKGDRFKFISPTEDELSILWSLDGHGCLVVINNHVIAFCHAELARNGQNIWCSTASSICSVFDDGLFKSIKWAY